MLDILVTFTPPPSLFKFIELEGYLSEILGVKVDLVMKNSLKPNIGKDVAEAVVQFYVNDLVTNVTTWRKSLHGFEKVELKPGESKTVRLILSNVNLGMRGRDMNFMVEPGEFRVRIGSSSKDNRLEEKFMVVE